MVTLGAVCIMEDNGKIENSYASRAFRMGAEFLTDEIIAEVAKEAVEKTSILFQAVKPKGGEMPVVMGPVVQVSCCMKPSDMRLKQTSTARTRPFSPTS